ncbi:hypothetical protein [Hymenobacter psychrotolerans]|nr:hypothetical protein [Hymenobacter psychrotolerans]
MYQQQFHQLPNPTFFAFQKEKRLGGSSTVFHPSALRKKAAGTFQL